MKKGILIILAFMLYAGSSFAQGFDPANIRAGAGLTYATEIGTIGLTLTGVYEIDQTWEGAFGFNYFFETNNVQWSVFDFDGHYLFHEVSPELNVYGLAGLSITRWSVEIPGITTTSGWGPSFTTDPITDSGSDFGFNLGVGANYSLNEVLNIAPELRYTVREGGYLRIGATAQYKF